MEEDKELYNNFLNGNLKDFEKIIEKYMNKIVFFIYGYVKKIDTAEDLAQDVFVYLLVNKDKFRFKCSLKTYFFLIAKSKALNYLKSYNANVLQLEDYTNIEDLKKLEDIVFNEIRDDNLRKAILSLEDKYAIAIYLSKIECLKIKDISKILDLEESNVKTLIHRGKKKLKAIIGEEEDLYA